MHANYSEPHAAVRGETRLPHAQDQQNFFTHPQIAISNIRASRGGRRYTPFAFTEHGAIMAASVLNTPRAIEVSVYVVRAFVRLRGLLATNKELARRFDQLETRIENRLADQDGVIVEILQAIRQLMAPPPTGPKRKIGFV